MHPLLEIEGDNGVGSQRMAGCGEVGGMKSDVARKETNLNVFALGAHLLQPIRQVVRIR